MSEEWKQFECEILEIAATFAELQKDDFDHTPPKNVVRDLKKLDVALTKALQAIVSLQLEHEEGQDISAKSLSFNWPVVMELSHARAFMNIERGKLVNEQGKLVDVSPVYPTDVINSVCELRDVVRFLLDNTDHGRGNSARRNPSSARMADLAKNFVFRFRSRFGYRPPNTKTGPVVELLRKMFEKAGVVSNDPAEQLRQAIKKDKVGRERIPSAGAVKASKRVK